MWFSILVTGFWTFFENYPRMVVVQPNKETIFTFNGSTSFFIVLMFFPFFLYFFYMAGSPMKFAEMPTKCRWVKNVRGEWDTPTPPPRDVSMLRPLSKKFTDVSKGIFVASSIVLRVSDSKFGMLFWHTFCSKMSHNSYVKPGPAFSMQAT